MFESAQERFEFQVGHSNFDKDLHFSKKFGWQKLCKIQNNSYFKNQFYKEILFRKIQLIFDINKIRILNFSLVSNLKFKS
jgi:hypothetical protein